MQRRTAISAADYFSVQPGAYPVELSLTSSYEVRSGEASAASQQDPPGIVHAVEHARIFGRASPLERRDLWPNQLVRTRN